MVKSFLTKHQGLKLSLSLVNTLLSTWSDMSIPPCGGAGRPPSLPVGPPCSKHLGVLSQTHRLSCWSLTPHSGGAANPFFIEEAEAWLVKLGIDHTKHRRLRDSTGTMMWLLSPLLNLPTLSGPVLICLWQLLLSYFVSLLSSPLRPGTYPLSEPIHPPEEYLAWGPSSLWPV